MTNPAELPTPRMSYRGPCISCGATDYQLSFGGPTICPACDAGINPEVSKLRCDLAAAIAVLKWYAEHPCPCWPWEQHPGGWEYSKGADNGQQARAVLAKIGGNS